MAIPKYQDFLYPFLSKLGKEQELSSKEIKDFLIAHFRLTEADCTLKTRSGKTNKIDATFGWVRQFLRRALLISTTQRGMWRITQRGIDYLKTHNSLQESDLLEFPEFAAFAVKKTKKRKNSIKISETNKDIQNNKTPTEILEEAYQSIINDLAADLLQKVLEQSPERFEHIVLDLLLKMGYGKIVDDPGEVTKQSHDGGIDGIIKEDKLGLDNIYIQAKRYTDTNIVGRPQIQQFVGAIDGQKANKGVFITTSTYSNEAKEFAKKASKKIVLIDGPTLAKYMIEYNVGVSIKQTFEIKRIDTDYFDDNDNY